MSAPPIVFCPTCGVDTIPLRNGTCGFCGTRLLEKVVVVPAHGTESRYRMLCRCDDCRRAAAAARKACRVPSRKPAWLESREARLAAAEAEAYGTVDELLAEWYRPPGLKA